MSELTPIEETLPPEPEQEQPEANFPQNEYIGGPAGTGKTFMMRERAETTRGVVLAATTGIAAVNLGEGVTTINSLLGFFNTESLRDAWSQGWLAAKLMKLYRAGLRHIVLDEVSMLDAEQLTILTLALDELQGRLDNSEEEGRVSEGARVGLTLTGDFCQLPPVKAEFAFKSDVWPRYQANTTILQKFWRQTDPQFLAALQDARKGNGARAAEFFEPFFQFTQEPEYPSVTLLAKNDEVDRYNALRLSKLQGEPVGWASVRTGKEKSEWKNIPQELRLKAGALVMILNNEREYDDDGQPGDMIYANGDLGELLDQDGRVKLRRTGEVVMVMPVTRQNLEVPQPGRAKELKQQGKRLVLVCGNMGCKVCTGRREGECRHAKYEIVGEITYMPLRCAYATTVHKSQGLTLEQVQVDFRDRFFESPGMLYVALSRCKSPNGLRLVGSVEQFVKRCKMDERVRGWA